MSWCIRKVFLREDSKKAFSSSSGGGQLSKNLGKKASFFRVTRAILHFFKGNPPFEPVKILNSQNLSKDFKSDLPDLLTNPLDYQFL